MKEKFTYEDYVLSNRNKVSKERLFIIAAVFCLAGLMGFVLGRFNVTNDENLPMTVEKELKNLRKDKINHDFDKKINEEAENIVRQENRRLLEQIAELEGNVTFYRNILQPSQQEKGITIESIKLFSTASPHRYAFDIVLTQNAEKYRKTKGALWIEVVGDIRGKRMTYSLSDVSINHQSRFAFDYKYFQNIKAEIELPKGFIPENVSVFVKSGKVKKNKTFTWQLSDK